MSWIDNWYKNDFIASIALIPISIAFIMLHLPWEYILYVDLVGILYFVLNFKAHRMLKADNIFSRSMFQASECIIRHKKLRMKNHMIVAIPAAVMVIWTIYIGGGQAWNLPSTLGTALLLACAIIGGFIGERSKMRKLDEVLQQIAKMR